MSNEYDPSAKSATSPKPEARESVIAEIEKWFTAEFHDSPVSRAGTEIYNHVHAAKDKLIDRVRALL